MISLLPDPVTCEEVTSIVSKTVSSELKIIILPELAVTVSLNVIKRLEFKGNSAEPFAGITDTRAGGLLSVSSESSSVPPPGPLHVNKMIIKIIAAVK